MAAERSRAISPRKCSNRAVTVVALAEQSLRHVGGGPTIGAIGRTERRLRSGGDLFLLGRFAEALTQRDQLALGILGEQGSEIKAGHGASTMQARVTVRSAG